MKISIALILITAASLSIWPSHAAGQKRPKTAPRKIITATTIPGATSKPEEEHWSEFVRTDSALIVSFPKAPEVVIGNDIEYTSQMLVRFEMITLQAYINQTFYMVNIRKYPKNFLGKRTDLAENFGGYLRDYILKGIEIMSETDFSYGRYKMVEFVYRPPSGELVIHRAVVIGDRLFQLLVQMDKDKSLTPFKMIEKNNVKIKKFFDSFRVTEENKIDSTVG